MNLSNNFKEEYTLVTGASGGIGREIAEEFARRGNNLVLVARNRSALENISKNFEKAYNIKVFVISINLSKKESPKTIYDLCMENHIKVNALINNAGAGIFGEFEKLDIEKQEDIINLNINNLVKLTHYFIAELKKCTKGYILNVASIAAFYPLPYYSVYGATKAFVLSFTEALRFEMRDSSLNICCLCPGDTGTNFFNSAGNRNKKKNLMSPKELAEIGVNSLFNNEAVIRPKLVKVITSIPRGILKKLIAKRLSKYKL